MKTIKERILYLLDLKGVTKEKFFNQIGMTYGSFKGNAKKTPLNSNAVAKILTIFPEINPMWLLTGEGEMLKNEVPAVGELDQKLEMAQKEIELLKKQIKVLEHETSIRKEEVQMLREMKAMQDKIIKEIKEELERCHGIKKGMPSNADK